MRQAVKMLASKDIGVDWAKTPRRSFAMVGSTAVSAKEVGEFVLHRS